MLTVPSSARTVSTGSSDSGEALSASISKATLRLLGRGIVGHAPLLARAGPPRSKRLGVSRSARAFSSYSPAISSRVSTACRSVSDKARRRQRIAWARSAPAWRWSVTSIRMLTAPANLAVLVDQRRRIGGEHHPRAVGPLGQRDGAADLALLLDRDRHRAVLVGEEGAVLAVELPGDAPAVLARASACGRRSRCRPGCRR